MWKRILVYLVIMMLTFYLGIAYLEEFPTILFAVEMMFAILCFCIAIITSFGVSAGMERQQKTITVGKTGMLHLQIRNRFILPVLYGELLLECGYVQDRVMHRVRIPFSVMPGQKERVRIPIDLPYAGTLRVELKRIRIYDYIHLFSFSRKMKRSRPVTITILPKFQQVLIVNRASRFLQPITLERSPEKLMDAPPKEQFYKDRVGDDPSEVFQIREFRQGDKLQRVHWKMTAKSGEMMVKDYSFPIVCQTAIVLDMSCGSQAEFQARMHTVVAFCISALQEGCIHTLIWFDRQTGQVRQQQIEKDEDLFEVIGMLAAAPFSDKLSMEEILEQCSFGGQLEQLLYVTGEFVPEEWLESAVMVPTKRILLMSIASEFFRYTEVTEKVILYELPQDGLQEALEQIQIILH